MSFILITYMSSKILYKRSIQHLHSNPAASCCSFIMILAFTFRVQKNFFPLELGIFYNIIC